MRARLQRLITTWFFTVMVLIGAGLLTLPEGFTPQHFTGLLLRAALSAAIVSAPTLLINPKVKL